MANKNLFTSQSSRGLPTDTFNEAGGKAYAFTDAQALAQYAVTGCLNGTFYADAETQLQTVLDLARKNSPEFVAKVAVYAREQGFMKDMPALLLAHLASRVDLGANSAFKVAFPRVIDDVKMLRNFVQIVRSGVTGRKSLGTAPKKMAQKFLDSLTDSELFRNSIGNDPSLADVIKMVHPLPKTETRRHLYAYLLGKSVYNMAALPEEARAFEAFKADPQGAPPDVNFQFLSSIKMSPDQWAQVAATMSWHTLRMNLNTLKRNGVFDIAGMDTVVAQKLSDAKTIRKVKVFPFQILMAYLNATDVPSRVRNALQDAVETATENTPSLPGKVVVAVDVSGSMSSATTGNRGSATSKVRCIDAAAMMAASILRRNDDAEVMPFDVKVHPTRINGRDSIVTNATKLAAYGGGGTDCATVLRKLNEDNAKVDSIIYLSDNESWVQSQPGNTGRSYHHQFQGTNMYTEWRKLKTRNPGAKLVCIDLQPNSTTQVPDDRNVLNVGGFSDRVFDIVNLFLRGELGGDHFVEVIEKTDL